MLVSIIIPAYNCNSFISNALESLLSQTADNWEAIVVNDGSSDGTADVVSSYCIKDKRIKLITQQNSGPSIARGRGVENCNGDWVTFLDSDDLLLPDAIATFTKSVVCGNSDIYIYSHQQGWKYNPVTISSEEYICASLQQEYNTGPWSKLFKRTLLSNAVFEVPKWLRLAEDWIMNVRISFALEGTVSFCKESVYSWRPFVNSDSLTKSYSLDVGGGGLSAYYQHFVNSIPLHFHQKYARNMVVILSRVYHGESRKIWLLHQNNDRIELLKLLDYFINLSGYQGTFFERTERRLKHPAARCVLDVFERCIGVIRRLTRSKRHKYYSDD